MMKNLINQFKHSDRLFYFVPVYRLPEGNVVKVNHVFSQGYDLASRQLVNPRRVRVFF
jgi:hypothetical protein